MLHFVFVISDIIFWPNFFPFTLSFLCLPNSADAFSSSLLYSYAFWDLAIVIWTALGEFSFSYCVPSQGYLLICCRGRRQKTYFWRRFLLFWNHMLFPFACVVTFFHYWVFWFLFFSANNPWTLLFPGTCSDSPSVNPTTLWAASGSSILAWLWHYQNRLSVNEKSKKKQAAGKFITDL